MGLLDFLFGAKLPEVRDPEHLRGLLFDAARAGDQKLLGGLCRAHQDAVLQHFAAWQKLPEDVRNDQDRAQAYVHGMVTVAEFFANRLGRPELLQRLMGSPASNPLVQWQEKLQQARALMEQLRYREAAGVLNDLLIDVRELKGSGVDSYLPVTHGTLGECYFQGGEVAKAVAPTEQALALCEAQGDAEGVVAYLGNLYEIHRYLGQSEQAARAAERLADALAGRGRNDEATWYRKQARLVRGGEPRNRVVAAIGDRRCELDELPTPLQGSVKFHFERDRISLHPSRVWTERGEKLGSAGRYDEALAAFREAARADVHDPHPHYLAGLTLLHLQRAAEAVESYEAAEERAPGWFHCRADLWLARQLSLGNLDHRAFLAVYALEDGNLPPAEMVKLAEQALGEFPRLAPLHLYRAKGLAALGRKRDAEAAYRNGLECADEPDIRTRLLVELAVSLDPGEERTRLLREAVGLNGNLVAGATAALCLRQK